MKQVAEGCTAEDDSAAVRQRLRRGLLLRRSESQTLLLRAQKRWDLRIVAGCICKLAGRMELIAAATPLHNRLDTAMQH